MWEYSPPIPKEAAAFSATPPPSTCPPACCLLGQGPPQRSPGAGRLPLSPKLQQPHKKATGSPYNRFLVLVGKIATTQAQKRSQSKEKAEATAPALYIVL